MIIENPKSSLLEVGVDQEGAKRDFRGDGMEMFYVYFGVMVTRTLRICIFYCMYVNHTLITK